MGQHRFLASWASAHEPSQAHLVGPGESELGYTHPPYLAVFIGGHDGIRISIHNPADVDNLAALLTVMSERFRTALACGEWDETTIDSPTTDDNTTGPGVDERACAPAGPGEGDR